MPRVGAMSGFWPSNADWTKVVMSSSVPGHALHGLAILRTDEMYVNIHFASLRRYCFSVHDSSPLTARSPSSSVRSANPMLLYCEDDRVCRHVVPSPCRLRSRVHLLSNITARSLPSLAVSIRCGSFTDAETTRSPLISRFSRTNPES
ncbi:hypothetical protein KIPE111705_45475 [Kibdelosporangium persicum]